MLCISCILKPLDKKILKAKINNITKIFVTMHVECFNYVDFTKAKELCDNVAENNTEKVEQLLKDGARPNILIENANGKAVPALEYASSEEMVMLLRKFGAITLEEYINEE